MPDGHPQVYYRIELKRVRRYPPKYNAVVLAYKVSHYTEKGVQLWVDGRRRFVLESAVKKYAHPTISEAADALLRRKERYYTICKARERSSCDELRAVQTLDLETLQVPTTEELHTL